MNRARLPERGADATEGHLGHALSVGKMMSIEPRNEPQMLRWFRKTYPSYDLQPLLLKRQQELEEARAFNAWLGELDDVSRLTEAVHSQVPRLRYARAERRGVERSGRSCRAVTDKRDEDASGPRLQPAPALRAGCGLPGAE